MGELIYRYVRLWTRVALPLFFRPFVVEGLDRLPRDGSYLLVANHQCAFLDAMILGAVMSPDVSYMTRSDVFSPFFDKILRALHMIPVYRLRDGYSTLRYNEESFSIARERLKQGQKLVIFPEAAHDPRHHLRPISKGAARLALQTRSEMDTPLYVIPCGINYFDHNESRHPLILSIGEAIDTSDYLSLYEEHAARAIVALRQDMQSAMRSQLMVPDEVDGYAELRQYLRSVQQVSRLSDARQIVADYDGSPAQANRSRPIWRRVLSIPILPMRMIMKSLIDRIGHPIFELSVKMAFAVIVFPLYAMLLMLLVSMIWGWGYAVWVGVAMVVSIVYSR